MINVEYEYINLKDGKRIETSVFYEKHPDKENYKETIKEELNNILKTTDNISHIHFGIIKIFSEDKERWLNAE